MPWPVSSAFGDAVAAQLRSILRIFLHQYSWHRQLQIHAGGTAPYRGIIDGRTTREARKPVAARGAAGLFDPAVASDPRRLVPGEMRGLRDHPVAIQSSYRACETRNGRPDDLGRGHRARSHDDDRGT